MESHSKLFDYLDELKKIESELNPQLPVRSDENWSKFFAWIDAELCAASDQNEKTKLSDQVDVLRMGSSERYRPEEDYVLIAKVPFKKGETLFKIDRRIMLTTETATKDDDLFEFMKNDSIASGMQNVVAVLHLLNEYSKGEQSFWWPYLSILPPKLLPVLMLDKQSIVNLMPSAHLFEALKMIRAIARQYSYFCKRFQSVRNLPLCKDFTFVYYAWGVSIVCSRQNEIPTLDRQACSAPTVHALIPILDMCNHNPKSNQAMFENNQSSLVATEDLHPYFEISINYGCRSSGEFYIHNGFVPHQVPADFIPLTIALNRRDSLVEAKTKLLTILNMPTFGRFKLTNQQSACGTSKKSDSYSCRNKRDPHLTMFLIVLCLNEQELELILNSPNPVGIADEIYEFVQYQQVPIDEKCKQTDNNKQKANGESQEQAEELLAMKRRLFQAVHDYLSKRASVCVAIIDRTLDSNNAPLDEFLTRLLQHEKAIYNLQIKS